MTNGTDDTGEDWRSRAEAAEGELASFTKQVEQRLLRSELKAAALRAGMVDLDGIALIDTTELHLDTEGNLPNATGVMTQLRRAKPWLFSGSSSSTGATPPTAQPPRIRLATEMSVEEWKSARAELVKRR